MAQVHFTAHLRAVVTKTPVEAEAPDVRGALHGVFETFPQLQGYVLDERGALRRHVCIFVDGERLANDRALDAPLESKSEVFVMQALSGG